MYNLALENPTGKETAGPLKGISGSGAARQGCRWTTVKDASPPAFARVATCRLVDVNGNVLDA